MTGAIRDRPHSSFSRVENVRRNQAQKSNSGDEDSPKSKLVQDNSMMAQILMKRRRSVTHAGVYHGKNKAFRALRK